MNKEKLICWLAPRERGDVVEQSWNSWSKVETVQVGWTSWTKKPKIQKTTTTTKTNKWVYTDWKSRSMQVMNTNCLNVHISARTLYKVKPVCLTFAGQEMIHFFKRLLIQKEKKDVLCIWDHLISTSRF